MQPLQCVLTHHVAHPHLSATHMPTKHGNNHAASALRSAARDSTSAYCYARMNNRTLQNTKREPICVWNDCSRHRRTHKVPFIAACNHFRQNNTRYHALASSPTQVPCNIHAAITVRVAAARRHFLQSPPPSSSPFVITLRLHFPQSPRRHHPPSSLPPATTPFVITFRPHFPQSPSFLTIFVITLRHHCPPSSPFVITHHFPPSPPPHSLPYVISCYLM